MNIPMFLALFALIAMALPANAGKKGQGTSRKAQNDDDLDALLDKRRSYDVSLLPRQKVYMDTLNEALSFANSILIGIEVDRQQRLESSVFIQDFFRESTLDSAASAASVTESVMESLQKTQIVTNINTMFLENTVLREKWRFIVASLKALIKKGKQDASVFDFIVNVYVDFTATLKDIVAYYAKQNTDADRDRKETQMQISKNFRERTETLLRLEKQQRRGKLTKKEQDSLDKYRLETEAAVAYHKRIEDVLTFNVEVMSKYSATYKAISSLDPFDKRLFGRNLEIATSKALDLAAYINDHAKIDSAIEELSEILIVSRFWNVLLPLIPSVSSEFCLHLRTGSFGNDSSSTFFMNSFYSSYLPSMEKMNVHRTLDILLKEANHEFTADVVIVYLWEFFREFVETSDREIAPVQETVSPEIKSFLKGGAETTDDELVSEEAPSVDEADFPEPSSESSEDPLEIDVAPLKEYAPEEPDPQDAPHDVCRSFLTSGRGTSKYIYTKQVFIDPATKQPFPLVLKKRDMLTMCQIMKGGLKTGLANVLWNDVLSLIRAMKGSVKNNMGGSYRTITLPTLKGVPVCVHEPHPHFTIGLGLAGSLKDMFETRNHIHIENFKAL